MDFIEVAGAIDFPEVEYPLRAPKAYYQYTNEAKTFHYIGILKYDGMLFYAGTFGEGYGFCVVEHITGACALKTPEIGRVRNLEKLYEMLKAKFLRDPRKPYEVLRDFKVFNLNMELWVINFVV